MHSDVESLMRKLRGETESSPPKIHGDQEDLKLLVKTLGAKLKSTHKDFLESKDQLALLQHQLQDSIQLRDSLQSACTEKEQKLALLSQEKQQLHAKCTSFEQELIQVTTLASSCSSPEETSKTKKELISFLDKEVQWNEEREQLKQTIEKEKQRGKTDLSSSNNQLIRLSMSCRQLEEDIHSVKCEKSAILRQLNQTKESASSLNSSLEEERKTNEQLTLNLTKSHTSVEQLESLSKEQLATSTDLSSRLDSAKEEITTRSSQIELLAENLKKEHESVIVLTETNEVLCQKNVELQQNADKAISAKNEAETKASQAQQDKQAADVRVKEVEEHLIVKLQSMAELEEALGETSSRAEELEHRISTSEKELEKTTKELKKSSDGRDRALSDAMKFEQHLSHAKNEIVTLTKRIEAFERLKKTAAEASAHAQAIAQLFDKPTPRFQAIPYVHPEEEPDPEESSPLEQYELF